MKVLKASYNKYREIISYLFWGVLTTVINWTSYFWISNIFEIFMRDSVTLIVLFSNVFSWICATVFAFLTNKFWVFRSKNMQRNVVLPEFCKFISTRLLTGFFETIVITTLVMIGFDQELFGTKGMMVKVVVSIVVVVLNYVLSKFFIFRNDSD